MQAVYLILRNNEEKGPFTLKELEQFSLHADDLVWLEGKSTSWCYPTEMESLKPYVIGENISTQNKNNSTEHPTLPDVKDTTEHKSYVYVQVPRQTTTDTDHYTKEEETTDEDILEKKADEIYQRVMAFSQQKQQQSTEIKTVHSRSLQVIKEEYVKKQPLRKKGISNKTKWVMSAGVAGIAAVGLFIAFYNISAEINPFLHINNFRTNAVVAATSGEIKKQPVATTNHVTKKPIAFQTPAAPDNSTVDSFIDSIEKELANQHRLANTTPQNEETTKNTNNTKQENVSPVLITENVTTELIPPEEKKAVPLRQLVTVATKPVYKSKSSLLGMYVEVQNNNTESLRLVTVAVTYYKKNGEIADQQTLLFQDVQPHSRLTLPAQSNKKAATATAQLIQVKD